MNKYQHMSDDYLRQNYVPDVYQPSIYKIDYQKLRDAGITFISFDIDDTITDLVDPNPPKEAMTLFANLKNMGFEIMLLSNTWKPRASDFAKRLGIEGKYIPRAEKPLTTHFQQMKDLCGLEKSQMAHIGNSIRDDVAGGNAFGITTCLVRRAGITTGVPQKIPGVQTQGQKLRKELKKRGIWRKHHKFHSNDQYYQLGEEPEYRRNGVSAQARVDRKPLSGETGDDFVRQATDNLMQKINADQDRAYTLDELLRNACEANEHAGRETLRRHLGEDIAFTGVWADAKDKRELDGSELLDGELSGYVFTVGGYAIRMTMCLLRDDDTAAYTQGVPAGRDMVAQYRQEGRCALAAASGVREVQAVSARYSGGGSEDWRHICFAATAINWRESIDFIGTLKPTALAPAKQEVLFVLKQYTGDSFGVGYWYKLSSNGTVAEYQEHGLDPEAFQEPWGNLA